jgi:CO/xanthine dehydrogenase FAD-binding subunit
VTGAFGYLCPRTLDEALAALAVPGARALAGGTDLMVAVRSGKAAPSVVVDVTRIPELQALEEEPGGGLRLGAALSHSRLAGSPAVLRRAPVLARASAAVGSVQVRNLGTLGGNVVNASVAADTLPALAILGARFEIAGPAGRRVLEVEEFFLAPGRTALGGGELLTAVLVPVQPAHGAAFLKVGRRRAAAISRLSVAAMADPRTGFARISIGAVFPKPRRIPEAEDALGAGFDAAGRAAQEAVRAVSGGRASMAYKLPVVRSAVSKALNAAAQQAGEGAA